MPITLEEIEVILKSKSDQLRRDFNSVKTLGRDISSDLGKSFNKIPFAGAIKGAFSMQGAFAAAAGVTGAALLTKHAVEAGDAIAKLSKNVGVSSGFLQGLQFAANQSGVETEALNSALLKFNKTIGDAANGSKEVIASFKNIGVSVTDASGNLKSSEELFLEVADGIGSLGSEAQQASALVNLFGRSGAQMVELFQGGSASIEKFRKEAEDLGLVISDDLLKGAEDLDDQMGILSRALSTQVTSAILSLAPEIQKLTEFLIEGAKTTAEYVKGFTQITESARVFRGETKSLAESQAFLIQQENDLLATREMLTKAIKEQGKSTADANINASERIDEINIKLGETRNKINENVEAHKAQAEAAREVSSANAMNVEQIKKMAELQAEAQKIVDSSGGEQEKLEEELKILEAAKEQKLEIEGDLNEALMEKRLELEEFKQELLEQEIEALYERNELLAQIGDEAAQKEMETNNILLAEKKSRLKAGTDFALEMRAKEIKADNERRDTLIKNYSEISSNIMTLAKGTSKELFAIGKGLGIATATIDGVVAIQKAASALPFPANIPGIAVETTRAAVNVSKIAGASFQKGIDRLPGIGNIDTIPAMVGPGEAIINRRGNEKLEAFLDQFGIMPGSARNATPVDAGGPSRIVVSFDTDRLVDFVEARLIERGRLGTSLEVA